MPVTRVWVPLIKRGVPVGTQVAWLSISKTGAPSEVTRVAKLINCAVTQGPPATGGRVHPATAYGLSFVTIGCPITITRGLGARGVAWPPCEQVTIAFRWSSGPGIFAVFFFSGPRGESS
jgi:hypothetical protein